jgi:hypothetical protein
MKEAVVTFQNSELYWKSKIYGAGGLCDLV